MSRTIRGPSAGFGWPRVQIHLDSRGLVLHPDYVMDREPYTPTRILVLYDGVEPREPRPTPPPTVWLPPPPPPEPPKSKTCTTCCYHEGLVMYHCCRCGDLQFKPKGRGTNENDHRSQ